VCSCENVRRKFGTPKHCIWVPKHTSFSLFCMNLGSETLQNTPKYHVGSIAGYLGVFVRKRSLEVRYPETVHSVPKHTSFSFFESIRVVKCFKTLPNIILGLMEGIGCVHVKPFVGSLVPRNSVFGYRNAPVSHRFACIRVAKCSKTLPHIILGLMDAIGRVHAKMFIRILVPRNSAFGYQNAPVSH